MVMHCHNCKHYIEYRNYCYKKKATISVMVDRVDHVECSEFKPRTSLCSDYEG